jgi:hypothetical protein
MIGSLTLKNVFSHGMTNSGWFSYFWRNVSEAVIRPHQADAGTVSVPGNLVFSSVEQGRSTFQSTEIFPSRWETVFAPRTDLGKSLYALRKKAINAGMKLISEEEILTEVKQRRGELEDSETDLC